MAESVVFNSNYYTGHFYDIDDGTVVYDEGRLPSPNSPTPMSGLDQSSYRITSLQIAYATDSSVPVRMRLRLWHQYFTCTSPASSPAPVADLTLDNLPATLQPGTFTPFTSDVTLPPESAREWSRASSAERFTMGSAMPAYTIACHRSGTWTHLRLTQEPPLPPPRRHAIVVADTWKAAEACCPPMVARAVPGVR